MASHDLKVVLPGAEVKELFVVLPVSSIKMLRQQVAIHFGSSLPSKASVDACTSASDPPGKSAAFPSACH